VINHFECLWRSVLFSVPCTAVYIRAGTADVQVSLSAFAYLYSELVQYHQNRVDSIGELERRLESSGYQVGLKVLELITYRNREVRDGKSGTLFLKSLFTSADHY
jgi:trafficking protein particle complex subunit 5